jgi:hypothetical protein
MDASDITRLLSTHHYSPADLDRVGDLCRNYPMFGLGHMLKVRIKEALGHQNDDDLKVASVYAGDRRKLYELIKEVSISEVIEEEPPEPEGIRFSDEPNQEAEVIIEQHAPYAGTEADPLLELDEEETGDSFILENDAEVEITSETVIDAVENERDAVEPVADTGPEQPADNRLILNFLNEEPGVIRADKKTSLKKDVSLSSIREHDGFITDTLAKIYVKQGLYAKAMYAYEKLSLKYPEKSAYFAAQIEKIRNINHS